MFEHDWVRQSARITNFEIENDLVASITLKFIEIKSSICDCQFLQLFSIQFERYTGHKIIFNLKMSDARTLPNPIMFEHIN